jgi:glycosyltransferase involved in cell wall biosynthesis
MINLPLISVALCTYNGEKFLIEQLDSLVYQTYKNLEIIVVDDCSSDRTINILNTYAVKYPFIKVYSNEVNLGYIKNFEKAILLCNGDFIALSDQDDIWDLNKITSQYNAIGDSMLIYHDSDFVDDAGKTLNKKMSDVVNMYEGDSFKPFMFFNCVSGHACLIKKELVSYCMPFPKTLFHDHWLAYTATNIGSIKYLNYALVKYRQHDSSDTNILKLERKEVKKEYHGVAKIKKCLVEINEMMAFKFNKDQQFLQKLYSLNTTRLNQYLCFGLVLFMYFHFKRLLYISKKSTPSKLNFVFKHLWGSKLKSE